MEHTLIFGLSPALLWFITGIVCFFLELLLPGFFIFFFGVSAWLVSFLTLFYVPAFSTQVLFYVLLSIITLLAFRSRLMHLISPTIPEVKINCEIGEVVEDIVPPACGKIKYSGSFWQATSDSKLVKGQLARVVSQNNLTLVVQPTDDEREDAYEDLCEDKETSQQ